MSIIETRMRKLWNLVRDHGEDRWWAEKQFRLEIARIAAQILDGIDPFVGCSSCGAKDTVLDSRGRTLCCGKLDYSVSLEGLS